MARTTVLKRQLAATNASPFSVPTHTSLCTHANKEACRYQQRHREHSCHCVCCAHLCNCSGVAFWTLFGSGSVMDFLSCLRVEANADARFGRGSWDPPASGSGEMCSTPVVPSGGGRLVGVSHKEHAALLLQQVGVELALLSRLPVGELLQGLHHAQMPLLSPAIYKATSVQDLPSSSQVSQPVQSRHALGHLSPGEALPL